jgi:gliding motility-associated lipoprotein GldH
MKLKTLVVMTGLLLLLACDNSRVYERYEDFDSKYWGLNTKPAFEFTIDDVSQRYNLYSNVRNAESYPWSRIFIIYHLQDSAGNELKTDLIQQYLFDAKSGEPFGQSGLGDIYDHQFEILKDYQFAHKGKFKVTFEQRMRTDSLEGILAVGLRVERVIKQ